LLLIYSHKITPRLSYIFKHIFIRTLNIPVTFTTKVEEFVAHNGPKLTYTKSPLGKEFFIKNQSLLFEQGINDLSVKVSSWGDVPCFFNAGEFSSIPFDIFAASFYLITRYEEYQPHVADPHERFSANQSIALQADFLEKPIVDIWAYKLLEKLKEKFPSYDFPKREFKKIMTINVNEAFSYKHKGIIRNVGGFFKDFFHFRLYSLGRRFLVIFRIKKDPYNTYKQFIELEKEHDIKTIFFFLFSEYTTFDNNVSYTNKYHKLIIKSILDYLPFGQLFSYYTMKNNAKINKEKNRFETVVNRPVIRSRQHLNRFEMPKTYQNLIDMGITEEYSMGYYTHSGFRAGTCTPFYFYDLDYEIQTPLKVFPFAINAQTLREEKLTAKEAYLKIKIIENEVKKVNGTFISIFHNTALSDMPLNFRWKKLYKKIISDEK
jgi:hypothetical protein